VLAVRDNGQGMDEETRRHALEAFFTTKDVGKGTGLGLSLCHSIITAHEGGEIQIESAPDVGTTVSIFLPLGNEAGQAGRSPSASRGETG
jgi:signal transduction histidine kinase